MKNKNWFLTTLVIIFCVAFTAIVALDFINYKNYKIPNYYKLQLQDEIIEEGIKTKYYIYDDMLIKDITTIKNNNQKETIEIYRNLNTSKLNNLPMINHTLKNKKPNRTITKDTKLN